MSRIVKVAFQLDDGRIYELSTREMLHCNVTLIDESMRDFPFIRHSEPTQVDIHMVFNVTDASIWMQSDPEELPERSVEQCDEPKRLSE